MRTTSVWWMTSPVSLRIGGATHRDAGVAVEELLASDPVDSVPVHTDNWMVTIPTAMVIVVWPLTGAAASA